jgi:uncharacterized protein with FMN-binding domain
VVRVRRIVMWFMGTVTIVVLIFGYHTSTSTTMATTAVAAPPDQGSAAAPRAGSGTSSAATTVTGPVAQTQWGPMQVQVTIDGSTITDVQVLQHPTGDSRSDQINAYALPILQQETLDAQSASIDMVSGATVTSVGYVQSLQAALDEVGL